MSDVKSSATAVSDDKSIPILLQNLLLYFVVTMVMLSFYSTQAINNPNEQGRIATLSFIVYLFIPFFKPFYEKYRTHFDKSEILYSFLVNITLVVIASFEIFVIYNQGDYYWEGGNSGATLAWYLFISLLIILYKSRFKIKSFLKHAYKRALDLLDYLGYSVKKYGFKLTLIPFILEWWNVRNLSNNYYAVYFAKKFIILQSKPIKATLPGLLPETINSSIKSIFENDLDRMQQLFKYNHIRTYSKSATLKFVMKTAEPIIKDLQLTLEQHLTEELLKENNDSKNLQVNVDNLWNKVEKILTQWMSTFSDSEMDYKDSLLVK